MPTPGKPEPSSFMWDLRFSNEYSLRPQPLLSLLRILLKPEDALVFSSTVKIKIPL